MAVGRQAVLSRVWLVVAIAFLANACDSKTGKSSEAANALPAKPGAKDTPAVTKVEDRELAGKSGRDLVNSPVSVRAAAFRRKYDKYERNSQQPLKANVKVAAGAASVQGQEKAGGVPSDGRDRELAMLPIWKREPMARIRAARQEILQKGAQEALPLRDAPFPEKRAWTKQWQERNRPELRRLDQEEQALLQSQDPPKPDQKTIDDLLARLGGRMPELTEADLAVIEHLLPSPRELVTAPPADEPTRRLMEARQLLEARFPQSAARKANNFFTTYQTFQKTR